MGSSTVVTVGVRFTVDPLSQPPDELLHVALRALRGVEVEAPTAELAELYAALLVDALERAGN